MNKWGLQKKPFLFIIDFELEKLELFPLDHLDNDILYSISGANNYDNYLRDEKEFQLESNPISFEEYKLAFEDLLKEINYGNSFLANLTFQTPIQVNASLRELFFRSKARYKLFYKNKFTVFSPETFVTIKNGRISSYPMKGTIDAKLPNAKNVLLNDLKEKAEHNTIVDLIRNDLNMVAKNVSLLRFRYIDRIKSSENDLLQVSSEISGTLQENYHKNIGSIILSLLPAGSISGAPKKKTIEILSKIESKKRGYYTGVSGIFDGNNLDSFVMIRYIEKIKNELFYRSGGGITYKSNAFSEYQEMIQKIYVPTA